MVEPLSIAAGIFSVVSSLNSLSERINDIRNAGSEIRQLQQEVNDLTLVLGKLDDARAQGTLQGTPLISLAPVLQNLNMEVVKTDVFLKEATKKTFRGPYWAFTGKSQCNRLLGRLESRKSTLTVTLELLQNISTHQIQDTTDQILSVVNGIRGRLTPSKDDYILQKYLTELETVYEESTVGGPPENATRTMPEYTLGEQQHLSANLVQNADVALPPLWSRPIEESGYVLKLSLQQVSQRSKGSPGHGHQIAARGNNFAVYIRDDRWGGHYGFMYRGFINGDRSRAIDPFILRSAALDPPINHTSSIRWDHRELISLAFLDNGTLIAEFVYAEVNHLDRRHFLVAWGPGANGSYIWKSAAFQVHYGSKISAFSHGGRLLAYQSNHSINIVETGRVGARGKLNHILDLSTRNTQPASQIVWSRDDKYLLVCKDTKCDAEVVNTLIQIYGIPSGRLISSISFADLHCHDLKFHFTDLQQDIIAIYRYTWGEKDAKPCSKILKAPNQASKIGSEFTFAAYINPTNDGDNKISFKKMDVEKVTPENTNLYQFPIISPDGSCFLGSTHYGEDNSCASLYLFDILHPTISGARNLVSPGDTGIELLDYQFAADGRRILYLEELPGETPSYIPRLHLQVLEC